MSGGGGSSSQSTNTSASTPSNVTLTPTIQAYQNLYGKTFAPPTIGTVPTQTRSNYDPARAQAMASSMYGYRQAGANANTSGYNDTLQAWQQMKNEQAAAKAAADKAKAEAAAAEAARQQQANWLSFMYGGNGEGSEGNGQMPSGATGGLASLQGFEQ